MRLRSCLALASLVSIGAGPALAENWVPVKAGFFHGARGMTYVDTDVQELRKGSVKFRGKFVLDVAQTNPDNMLKYKEIRSSFEANCTPLKIRHLLSTFYGPKSGVQFQLSGEQIPVATYVRVAKEACKLLH
jgi:hypothetical protein